MEGLHAQWLSADRKDTTPMEMRTDLARLESAFPAFSFAICRGWDGPRIEAWRDTTRGGLYAGPPGRTPDVRATAVQHDHA